MTRIHQHRVKRARLGEEFKAAVYKADEQYTLSTTVAMAPIIDTLTKHCDALCHIAENGLQFREQVHTVTWWIHLCLWTPQELVELWSDVRPRVGLARRRTWTPSCTWQRPTLERRCSGWLTWSLACRLNGMTVESKIESVIVALHLQVKTAAKSGLRKEQRVPEVERAGLRSLSQVKKKTEKQEEQIQDMAKLEATSKVALQRRR